MEFFVLFSLRSCAYSFSSSLFPSSLSPHFSLSLFSLFIPPTITPWSYQLVSGWFDSPHHCPVQNTFNFRSIITFNKFIGCVSFNQQHRGSVYKVSFSRYQICVSFLSILNILSTFVGFINTSSTPVRIVNIACLQIKQILLITWKHPSLLRRLHRSVQIYYSYLLLRKLNRSVCLKVAVLRYESYLFWFFISYPFLAPPRRAVKWAG